MSWPKKTQVLAFDISSSVIRALWPGDIPGLREAKCASWAEIPRLCRSCDVIVGDGSLNTCRFPGEVQSLVRSLSRALKAGGILVARVYTRPKIRESLDTVFNALYSPSGLSIDVFKMRLFLAMQKTLEAGVAVREAASVLKWYGLNREVMTNRLGWSDAATEPFTSWRTSNAVYSFPSLAELYEVFGRQFEEVSTIYPTYQCGDCCPIIVMRKTVPYEVCSEDAGRLPPAEARS